MKLFSSVRIYFRYLVTAEAWILCLVSVASTLFFTMFEVKGRRLAVNVSWAFISFAIIFPLTNSLNETFRRRERALECIADVKAYLLSYYQAHRTGTGVRTAEGSSREITSRTCVLFWRRAWRTCGTC